jgi:hypothetical protein
MRASLASGPGDATMRGSVELDSARELEQRLRDAVLGGTSTVIVDLSGIEDGQLLIACESAAIRHQLADLNDIFELVDARPQRR